MPSLDEQDGVIAFGKNVRRIRKEKNLTMEELANIAEIEISQIYRIENAKRNIRLSTVFTIAKALGVDPHVLFMNTPY
ncbi:Helix-turn-helix domain-containing protein [Mucilaginibacter gossypiicola]|uniref:Helix-turn-helix domain-containing protein n=1 Tax=Mucilaginibacter gossypiicola TaxID=551995 RepID=A0A1H8SZA9_9SPHI|nr:helix-turn-helix transcriptional regulator [Mucilaginibacter gossypiicola]SEO84110.1 Helix-turn-helix domain-containing protein [Mucilaginibacter gossypiicola]